MSNSQRPFWRTPIAITLALSAIAHALTYWVIPQGIAAWTAPSATQFDAVITAKEEVTIDPAILASPPTTAKPVVARVSKPRPPKPVPVVKPETSFVAPENVIAVAPPAPAPDPLNPEPYPEPRPSKELPRDDTGTDNAQVAKTEPLPPAAVVPATPAEPRVVVATAATTAATAAPTVDKQIEKITDRPNFPERLTIAYKMTSSVADGVADFKWKRNGGQYEIDSTIQPTGLVASMFAGTFRQTSRGDITDDGIAPAFFSMQRGDAQADTAEFKPASNELKIIKHGETHVMPLPQRMQDMQSFLFQMAHDAPSLGNDPAARITVNVTNARKVYQYKFLRVGEETLDTRMGPIATIHLKSESSNPEDVYEVWLAPSQFYMPVKLKFYMGRFAVEQVATRINVTSTKP
jgi:Protein of unknown function (DUF3108)